MRTKKLSLLFVVSCGLCFPSVADDDHSSNELGVNYRSRAMAIRFSRDGKELISAGAITGSKYETIDKRLRVWNVKSGLEVWRLPAEPISPDRYSLAGKEWIGNTLLMPDFDLMLTTWGSYEVKIVHIHSFHFEEPLEINTGVITALELSPDEKIVAIGTRDFVQFRDAKTLRLLRTYASATGGDKIHFGPNSQTILVGYKDEINVQSAYWMGEPVWLPRVQDADAYAFSPDGKRLARAKGQTIEIWTTATRDPNYVKPDDMGRKLKTLKTVLPVVWRLQFSPDGKTLAVGGLSKSLVPVEFLAMPQ